MITGDSSRVAREVAREVGIDESRVLAEVLPQDKGARGRTPEIRGQTRGDGGRRNQ